MKLRALFLVSMATFCGSYAGAPTKHSVDVKPQSVMEFYQLNPTHERCKLLSKIFEEAKPRPKIVNLWRIFVTGQGIILPNDHLRHYFYMCAGDIGQELGWSSTKIEQEVNALFQQIDRIRNS